jgi:ferredoxin-NADP reductase
MSYYTHRRHKDAGQYVHVDMPLCDTGDLNHYTHHKHLDGPQHIRVDVQAEASVRKKINIFINNQIKIS